MQRHLLVTPLYKKLAVSLLVETVVVGNATVLASNAPPQVIARAAVPVISINNASPSLGVPVMVNPVIATANPLIWNMSQLSVLTEGVAVDATCITRLVLRLFVNVIAELE